MLQRVAVWCSVEHCGAVWYNVFQRVAVCCNVLQPMVLVLEEHVEENSQHRYRNTDIATLNTKAIAVEDRHNWCSA